MSADFIDTNVFVYLFDETDPQKRGIAAETVKQAIERGTGAISYQVAQEALNVLTSKLNAAPTEAQRFLDDVLSPLWRLGPSPELFERALEIRARYAFGWYDALIVASAIACGSERLLSEDLQHGQRIGRLQIVNPFATTH
ncbi:MAG: PIN domain-containing protein [Trueperaceae bacterium]|nr:PIN domain-containing protein [Trueperaceae bacterium]